MSWTSAAAARRGDDSATSWWKTHRAEVVIALIAAGAALFGSGIGSRTAVVIAKEQAQFESRQRAVDGLRAERRNAYAEVISAEIALASSEELFADCNWQEPRYSVSQSIIAGLKNMDDAERRLDEAAAPAFLIASPGTLMAIDSIVRYHREVKSVVLGLPGGPENQQDLDQYEQDLNRAMADLSELRLRMLARFRLDLGAGEPNAPPSIPALTSLRGERCP